MIRQAFADVIVAPQARNTRNVLHRALDELDLLSLQLRPDMSTSNESGASSQSYQSDSLQNARRNRSELTVMRNVCDRLGLSPPSSPSLGRRTDGAFGQNSVNSRRRFVQHGKFTGGRSLALDTLDLEVGRRRTCAKVLSRPRYQRVSAESSKLLPGHTNDSSQTPCATTNTHTSYTPLNDRQTRKRMERCKRLRKPYDLPWRAQKSATLNTLFADVDGAVSRRTVELSTDAAAYNASQSHARRVSAPSVLDTDDECATPTQSQAGATSQGGSSNGARRSNTIESVAEAPTPTGSQFASPTSNMQVGDNAYRAFADRAAESPMIGDAPETGPDAELAETESHTQAESATSGVHSLGLSTTLSVCSAFTNYAQTTFDAAPSVPDCFTSRSQSNSVDSKSPAVSTAAAPSNASSQCLSRSRSLDTVGIGVVGACTLDPSDAANHYHAAAHAHAHFHSSHASYVSQAHSPHTSFTQGSDSLTSQPGVFAASSTTATFAYPAAPLPAGHHPRTLSAQGNSSYSNVHNYTHYWRSAATAGQPQTSAGVLDSSAPRPMASSQQAALQKYGVEDMMAHSMRHLRLNDR